MYLNRVQPCQSEIKKEAISDRKFLPVLCICPSLAQSRHQHGESRRAPRRESHREGLVNGLVTRFDYFVMITAVPTSE